MTTSCEGGGGAAADGVLFVVVFFPALLCYDLPHCFPVTKAGVSDVDADAREGYISLSLLPFLSQPYPPPSCSSSSPSAESSGADIAYSVES